MKREPLEPRAYWRANLKVIGLLLSIWLLVGLVLSVILVEPLNRFRLGGYPLGFWFAQQGSIFVFIALIFIYAKWMDRIDRGRKSGSGKAAGKAER